MSFSSFLDRLEAADRDALQELGRVRQVPAGAVLLAHGQVPDRIVVLQTGWAKVTRPSPAGQDVVLALRGPGELVGEQALVDGRPRGASLVALEELEALVVPASVFAGLMDRRTPVTLALLGALSERLRDADRRLVELSASDTLGRVCARLTGLVEDHGRPGEDGSVLITLGLTQEELASWVGASIEATGKALRALRKLGWVQTGRKRIVVVDPRAVAARAATTETV